jgi:hypothetical protein
MPGCQTREENAADLAREELVGGVFALALNDAAQDVLGYFDLTPEGNDAVAQSDAAREQHHCR